MYAKNRTHCAPAKVNGTIVCEKTNTLRCREGKRAYCMRKIAYIALPRGQTSLLYAKNRIHCAATKANGTIVCEKTNTLYCREGKRDHCMRNIEYIALPRGQTSLLYAKNRTHCAPPRANEPIVCEKSNTLRCREGKRAYCMRKIAYIALPRGQTSLLYAKNRIHCAPPRANEPIVCEKSNTLCSPEGKQAYCMRKIEYIVLPRGQTSLL